MKLKNNWKRLSCFTANGAIMQEFSVSDMTFIGYSTVVGNITIQ